MTVSFDRAKTLLTDKSPCYTLEDVERAFGVTYTPVQRIALENIPFSEVVLKACVGTHMLFPGFPLSLLDIREKCKEHFYTKTGGWYSGEPFAKNMQVRPSWHLLRMEQVPDSLRKTWDEQKQLLLSDEEVPSSALVAYATMLHFGASKQRLFERCYVRTSDVDSGGGRVYVGFFDDDGFGVRGGSLGLASARKSS